MKGALVALTLVLVSATAHAQGLEEARRAYYEVDLERARELFESAAEQDDLDLAVLGEARAWLGAIAFMLGEPSVARAHLDDALWLQPGVTLPEGSPPDVESMLEELRRAHEEHPLVLEIVFSGAGMRARVLPTTALLRARLRATCATPEGAEVAGGEGGRDVVLALEGPARCSAQLMLGSHVVASAEREHLPGAVVVAPPPQPPTEAAPTTEHDDAPLVIGLAVSAGVVVAVVVGVVLGLTLTSATSELGVTVVHW